MDEKGLGATLVIGPGDLLLGIFTDGDLRRALRNFPDLGARRVDEVMTANPRTINADCSVADGLEVMEQLLITVLPVVDRAGKLQGILHLHDLLGKGKIRFTPTPATPNS
jgi:arabinose-5-phosphate isomerase